KDGATGSVEVDLDRPTAELVVELRPGSSIRGRFLDAESRPVANAVLHALAGREGTARSGADGRFRLDLGHGHEGRAGVTYPTGRSIPGAVQLGGRVPWFVARTLGILAGDAGDRDLGDVVLKPGRPVAGRVVDGEGVGLPRCTVSLFLEDVNVG